MKGIYLTQEGKQEIEAKIALYEYCTLLPHQVGELKIYKEILSSSTILPVEEVWNRPSTNIMNNHITANKCEVGKIYYLTGEYFNEMDGKNLINTPVTFKGRDRKRIYSSMFEEHRGQYVFLTKEGDEVEARAKTVLFLQPINYNNVEQN